MPVSEFLEPTSLEHACGLLASDPFGATAIAGGTAVTLMLGQGLIAPDRLVSLARLPGLRGVDEDDGTVRIGAGTTLTEVAASPVVRRWLPSLAYATSRVGNVRVRNVATLGGNLAEADYASDPPAVLVSLGASCRLQGPHGTRTVPVDGFVTGYYTTVLDDGELITDLVIPAPPDRHAVYLKYVTRSSEDRPCVGVAARADLVDVEVRDLDVVIGAVGDRPQRVAEVLDEARGQRLDGARIERIAEAYRDGLDPMEDARGSAWYRREMIAVFVRRALSQLAARAEGGATDG